MKKCLCLLLAAILLGCSFPAAGEETFSAAGAEFDLRVRLNAEAFPAARRARMRGYADLLEALSFRGSFCYDPEHEALDVQLEIIPQDAGASPVTLHFFGPPDQVMLSTPLFGEETLLFSNISLLDFVLKIHEHLGLNLQVPALMYPWVYTYCLKYDIARWNGIFNRKKESRSITAKKIRDFTDYLAASYENHRNVELLIRTFCLDNDFEETIRSEVYNLPAYLSETVTRGKKLQITVKPGSEVWSVGKSALYTHTLSDAEELISADLPLTPGGYQPAFAFSRRTVGGVSVLALTAGWTRDGADDLLDLRFSAEGIPASWPAAAESSGSLSLRGALYPDLAFDWSGLSDASGQFTLTVKEPSGTIGTGELLTLEGTVLPRVFDLRSYSKEELAACVDILRVNDVSLAEFKNRVMSTALLGTVRFLSGIPASACRSLLDDLTDLGILDLLVAE